jgi:toxin ParE1/3/4
MYEIGFKKKAENELNKSFNYYNKRSVKYAKEFLKAIESRLLEVRENPYTYVKIEDSFHETYVKKFPFTIVFKIDEPNCLIIIISIFHQRRNPAKKLK